MIKLFWCPRTRASRILWLLEELDQPFEVRLIDIRDAESRSEPDFRQASPMGKVPAIEDGEVRMAESAAIALYLADRYPAAGLAPAIDDPLRGSYLYWMTFTPAVIEPSMMEKFNGWSVNRANSGWGDFDLMIETLSAGLQTGPWLLGDQFSAADVIVGSSVYFMRQFGLLPESKPLNDYAERCLARPAYAKALARDEEMPD
ncbi:MAG TPA: glutathione S-transferase [Xanthomonadales bacterium]|nr:glutathione S-transferase [Xanthomonadales bacterium]